MIWAYFDESSIHNRKTGDKKNIMVAGCAAELKQWGAFSREWAVVLADNHIKKFHATDFAHSEGEFKGWRDDEPKRRELLNALLEIMDRHVGPNLIGSCITLYAGRSFKEEYSKAATECGFISSLLFQGGVSVVFDRQNEFKAPRVMQRIFRSIAFNQNIKNVANGDSETVLPLQAADLIAYELCLLGEHPYATSKTLRYPLQRILKNRSAQAVLYF